MSGPPSTTFDASRVGWHALNDLIGGLKLRQVWLAFAISDVRLRYRRTYLGPFWITISTGIMVAALGYVFGSIFKADVATYVPYIAIGMVVWGYVAATMSDGCTTFTSSTSYIRNLSLPLSTYLYRTMARNVLTFLHNLAVVAAVFVIFPPAPKAEMLLAVPGLILLTANLTWIALILGVIASRYRDVPAAVTNLISVSYLVTPILWQADLVEERRHIVDYNPFYHLIEIVRAPLLGHVPTPLNYGFSVSLLVIGTLAALYLYKLKAHRLSYWL